MSDSYVIRKERCPKCAEQGRDTSGDNLIVYNDGHSFCYGGCGLVVGVSGFSSLKTKVEQPKQEICLPSDCDVDYPHRALKWIEQYELGRNDLLNNSVFWSEYRQRLIFPVFGDGSLIAYQGRYFGQDKKEPKWFGKGNLKDTFNILGPKASGKIVLVEDIISAIKVSKCDLLAMPLYGSFVGVERFKRLYKLFGKEVEVLVWLDPDKRKEAIIEANRGMLCGLKTRTIFSDKDPKEHSWKELNEILLHT